MELTAQKRAHQSGQTSSIGQELSTLHPMLNIEVVTENEDETGLGWMAHHNQIWLHHCLIISIWLPIIHYDSYLRSTILGFVKISKAGRGIMHISKSCFASTYCNSPVVIKVMLKLHCCPMNTEHLNSWIFFLHEVKKLVCSDLSALRTETFQDSTIPTLQLILRWDSL